MRAFFCLCSLRISPEETSENVCECDVRWNRHRCFIGNSPKAMIIKLSLPDFALLSFGPYWWPPLPLHHSYLPSPYTEISPSFFHMCSRTLSISICIVRDFTRNVLSTQMSTQISLRMEQVFRPSTFVQKQTCEWSNRLFFHLIPVVSYSPADATGGLQNSLSSLR